jgi:hypothetical protein
MNIFDVLWRRHHKALFHDVISYGKSYGCRHAFGYWTPECRLIWSGE